MADATPDRPPGVQQPAKSLHPPAKRPQADRRRRLLLFVSLGLSAASVFGSVGLLAAWGLESFRGADRTVVPGQAAITQPVAPVAEQVKPAEESIVQQEKPVSEPASPPAKVAKAAPSEAEVAEASKPPVKDVVEPDVPPPVRLALPPSDPRAEVAASTPKPSPNDRFTLHAPAPREPAPFVLPEKPWFALAALGDSSTTPGLLQQEEPTVCAADRSLGTAMTWAKSPEEASAEARKQDKLVFVIHVSGNFENPGFT